MFSIYLGDEGLRESQQEPFKKTVKCIHCGETARIGFVINEIHTKSDTVNKNYVCDVHKQGKDGKLWLHDLCSVAIYFCERCLEVTAKYNQG